MNQICGSEGDITSTRILVARTRSSSHIQLQGRLGNEASLCAQVGRVPESGERTAVNECQPRRDMRIDSADTWEFKY